MHKKLVVVADSTRCALYEAHGLKIVQTVANFTFEDSCDHHEKRKRMPIQHNVCGPSHGYELKHSPKDLDRSDFCQLIAHKVSQHESGFAEIILVAEPKTLGELRRHLTKKQLNIVSSEIHRDLIKMPIAQLEAAIFQK